jgi:hypothetical protein
MSATVYSFKDLVGAFSHTSVGQISIGGATNGTGQMGIGQIVVHMTNDITTHEISIDGGIIPFVVPVYNGTISIQCQQTSLFNYYLLDWYNSLKLSATSSGSIPADVSNWANAVMLLKNIKHGTQHNITGISPQNSPDKTYAAQAGSVNWSLLAANIESINI